MHIKQLRKYLARWCSPDEARAVGWAVVGLRAVLIEAASAADMAISGGEEGMRMLLRLSESDWEKVRERVLTGWHKDTEAGKFWLPEPAKAVEMPTVRGAGGRKSDSPFKSRPGRTATIASELPLVPAGASVQEARQPKAQKEGDLRDRFLRFWEHYPKKASKEVAFTAFKRHAPNDALLETMIADVRLRAFTTKWSQHDGSYVSNASTYLNNSGWTEPLVLNETELAASTLPEKERRAFLDKNRREVTAWVTTQRVLGQIPTLMDLAAHLGIAKLPESVQEIGGAVVRPTGDVIDVTARPANASAPPLPNPEVLDAAPAERALVTVGGEAPPTGFRAELLQALSGMDEERRRRILAKPEAMQRQWLKIHSATAQKAPAQKNEVKAVLMPENTASERPTGSRGREGPMAHAGRDPVIPTGGDRADWW